MSKPDWAVGQQGDQPGDRDRRLCICDRPGDGENAEFDIDGSGNEHDVDGVVMDMMLVVVLNLMVMEETGQTTAKNRSPAIRTSV